MRRQGPSSKALRAAFTARFTSALSPSATCVMTSPVAGLRVGKVFPLTESIHRPSTSILVWRIWTGDEVAFGCGRSGPLVGTRTGVLVRSGAGGLDQKRGGGGRGG